MAYKDDLEAIFLKPWFGGITAVTTVMAGAFASFFTNEIKSFELSAPSVFFWLAVCLTGISLSGASWAQNRSARRERRALQSETKELKSETSALKEAVHRIESLPPEGFLAEYQVILGPAFRSTLVIHSTGCNVADAEQAIRNVLGGILELAKSYDKAPATTTYGANIMLYRQCHGGDGRFDHRLIEAGHNHPDYDGYLQVASNLSTTTTVSAFARDPNIVDLAIHIPKNRSQLVTDDGKTKSPVVPGAPWALVYKEFASFTSISTLDSWLAERCSVDEAVKARVKAYFRQGAGKHIKSFACMPIFALGAEDEAGCVGILNIHSSQEGLLVEKGGERFAPLMEPFRQLLSILLMSVVPDSDVFREDVK